MSESTRGAALSMKRYNETAAYRRKIGKPTRSDVHDAGWEAGVRAYAHCVRKYGEEAMSTDFEKRSETIFSSVFRYEASIGRDMDREEQSLFIDSATEAVQDSMSLEIKWGD